MRTVVTGGAGFLGSHLCERLLAEDCEVLCIDSLLTGSRQNVEALMEHPRFGFAELNVVLPFSTSSDIDLVMHLACPASPVDYQRHPLATLEAGSMGTLNALALARVHGARFFLASTSEVYGDPLQHPQRETYWGNVNPVGPRSMYDEAKRFAEAAASAYQRTYGLDVRIARIFNTYGPRMQREDGRAVPSFISAAIKGEPLPVHGDGLQTRSLLYVDDLIEGIWRLMNSDVTTPVNLGSSHEVEVVELAETIRWLAKSDSEIIHVGRPGDDPQVRRPDVSKAEFSIGWKPQTVLAEGLLKTIEWAREAWS